MNTVRVNPTQADLIAAVVGHSANHSPYYSRQAWAAKVRRGRKFSMLAEIPITPKQVVRENPSSFYSSNVPRNEGKVLTRFTSGSFGHPLTVKKTELQLKINHVENARLRVGWEPPRHTRRVRILSAGEIPAGEVPKERLANGGQVWTLYGLEASAAADLVAQTACTMIQGYPSIVQATLVAGAGGALLDQAQQCADLGRGSGDAQHCGRMEDIAIDDRIIALPPGPHGTAAPSLKWARHPRARTSGAARRPVLPDFRLAASRKRRERARIVVHIGRNAESRIELP